MRQGVHDLLRITDEIKMMDDIFLALGMMSRIKVPRIKQLNYARSTIYFPLIGFLAAGILWVSESCLNFLFPFELSRLISLSIYFLLFGYFHFDGYLDVIDGFFPSHKQPEERLKIMKDSNTGAFALLFGVLFIAIELFCIFQANDGWILFPVFGRFSVPVLLSFSKPASNKGLGKLYFPYPIRYALFAFFFMIPLLAITPILCVFIPLQIGVSLFLSSLSKQKINGINGDVIGFSIMINELLFLIFLNHKFFS